MSKQAFPEYVETSELGNKGRRMVETCIHETFRWLFREIGKDDLGIDGLVEVIGDDRKARGRIFAVQIKCGHSFFSEERLDGFVYRGSMEHLNYWVEYSLPVVLIICNPDTRVCYWVEISPGVIERHTKGWSVVVPKSQTLSADCEYELRGVVRKPLAEDFIPLALYRLLYEKYPGISIAPVLATPHDFLFFDELARLGDDFLLVTYLYKPTESFAASDIRHIMDKAEECAAACGWKMYPTKYRVLIAFVGHSAAQLALPLEVVEEIAKHATLETFRAVCDFKFGVDLTEVDQAGNFIVRH
ncbi:DUF4365 domain-containing protein [Bradyrhizobium sp. AZCC 2289]|uniref:DUF4365 domain-containing protein n=1 Tax=Bradyrhizobium sp. AZCC 2289 TaxID=3117026 RepID=UPI002FF2C841